MLFFIKGNLKEFKFGRFCSIIFFERNITAITNVKKCTFAFMNSEFGKYLEKFNITSLNKMQEETIEAINNNKDTLVLSLVEVWTSHLSYELNLLSSHTQDGAT